MGRGAAALALGLGGGVAGSLAVAFALHAAVLRGPAQVRVAPQPPGALSLLVSPATEVYRRVGPSVVLVGNAAAAALAAGGAPSRQGWGSGVIFDSRGYIVTNAHVVDGAQRIEVTLADGTELSARLVGSDPSTDLAVVQVDAGRPLPAAVFGDSRTVRPGELAVAIGNPLGPRFAQSVTQGIVSAVRPMLYGLTAGSQRVTEMIQTDAAINPGSSGGPLLNASGEVIGITSVKIAQAQPGLAASGLGFAIPSDVVRRVVDDLVRYGHVRRAWLGVQLEVAPPVVLPGEPQTILIAAVAPGSPAAAAGLVPGDRIVAWDGRAIANYYDLVLRINAAEPGSAVRLTVERDGERRTARVTLGVARAPAEAAPEPAAPPAG